MMPFANALVKRKGTAALDHKTTLDVQSGCVRLRDPDDLRHGGNG
jgi:hypothetical protein